MMRIKTIQMVAVAALVAGCADYTAGTIPQSEDFGSAAANNELVQTAYLNSEARLIALNDKFKAEVDEAVYFDFDRSSLDSAARAALDGQARWLIQNSNVRMRVFGHTDLVGSNAYNDRLGLRRARAVVRYLAARGVARNRLDAVVSRGEREPVVQTQDRERLNRRTITEVAGFTSGFVGDGLDGRRAVVTYRRYTGDAVEAAATGGGDD